MQINFITINTTETLSNIRTIRLHEKFTVSELARVLELAEICTYRKDFFQALADQKTEATTADGHAAKIEFNTENLDAIEIIGLSLLD